MPKNTEIPYWNGLRDMGCCISVNLRLKIRISLDQKHLVTPLSRRHHLQKNFAAAVSQASQLAVKVACIDVDDASSSAPPATSLRESDHSPTHYVDR